MTSKWDIDLLTDQLASGDRSALGKAITIVESQNPDHREMAGALLDKCLNSGGDSFRFAISGPPGVGKSTFIEALGGTILETDHKLAILAIDPSSHVAKGAILGDKTRMPELSRSDQVYIRPTAARATLGGVAASTRESIALCEAAGYDRICIETVGVGQSEVDASNMVDCFVLLLNPGSGDELQGIKKGIVELADGIVVNKADGKMEELANETCQHYKRAIHLLAPKPHDRTAFVMTSSALEGAGIKEVWTEMEDFHRFILNTGYKQKLRTEQDIRWLNKLARDFVNTKIMSDPRYIALHEGIRHKILAQELSVTSGFSKLRGLISEMLGD